MTTEPDRFQVLFTLFHFILIFFCFISFLFIIIFNIVMHLLKATLEAGQYLNRGVLVGFVILYHLNYLFHFIILIYFLILFYFFNQVVDF